MQANCREIMSETHVLLFGIGDDLCFLLEPTTPFQDPVEWAWKCFAET